ncbi:hypothetical protein BG015_004376 [Linnemannia schmuckeri]|uniref:TPX2 C-terminal domain-containing protein n=1 Tax=Linnemannia schmuckeri TaxID=64567 RepID=A0A9P5V0A5_9FUNG|nr:hypothetical protein BG015_004376 [Linnemannia schmuckeri]
MQRTSATTTTSTKGRSTLTATIPSRSRTTVTATKGVTGTKTATGAAAMFNIGPTTTTTTTTTSRPSYSQPTRPSTLAGLLSSKKTLVSLSTLATAKVSTTTSTTSTSSYRFSFGDASDNPFLEQPPRKLFKDAAPTPSPTNQQSSREALSKIQEPAKQQGLVLTRVLPINSPARIPAAVSTQVARDSSTTTTKLLPKADYDRFLSKSTAHHQDSNGTEESYRDGGGMGDTLRKSLRTTAMDIARKSIMQHANASPRKTFLKVSEVAARSHGEPSLHDLLVASETDDNVESRLHRPVKAIATHSFGHPDTPFTFESTPLPPLNPTTASQEPHTRHDFVDSERATSTHDNHTAVQETVDSSAVHDRDVQEPSFDARVSMAHRAAPYKILSVNERESLRASRGTGFRARPVDPKVFTRAGELGVPRVVKPPLTIPVSPVFSKRVRSKTIAPAPVTTATKSSLRSGPVRTAAFQRLVNVTKPSQRKDADSRHSESGSNDGKKTVDAGKETRQSSTRAALPSATSHTAESQTTSSIPPAQESAAAIYPSTSTSQKPHGIGSSSLFRPPATNLFRKTTLGPPLRGNGPSTTAVSATSIPVAARIPEKTTSGILPTSHSRKPVTQPVPFQFATDKLRRDEPSTSATAPAPGPTEEPATMGRTAGVSVHSRKPVTHKVPFKFATDKLRREGCDTTVTSGTAVPALGQTTDRATSGNATAVPVLHARRPLTQPVPFKFATDDILRRRHVMFQSRGHSKPAAQMTSAAPAVKEKAKPANTGVFRRPQPLKRLTIPVPFHLATQRRAEVRPPVTRYTDTHESAALSSIRTPPRRSRLAGVFPVPTGHPIMTSSVRVERPHPAPTVPISPKLGRRVPVPSLRPTHFVLKKSTKELTQPHEFRFHSDQRAKEREEYERQQASRKREQELLDLQQKSNKIHQEREERMRMRESLERTFRARPIAHYQPTVIHKATRPLTKPVSPMIGEKRRRYEMEQQHLEQQRQEEEYREQQQHQQFGYSQDRRNGHHDDSPFISSPIRGSIPDEEVYRTFEEAKILQVQQQALQQQLTEQERRQVVLANSARATIHQPPIRLSFPMDPETEALQEVEDIRTADHHHGEDFKSHEELEYKKSSSSAVPAPAAAAAAGPSQPQPLPPVRDSFGGSNNHRLSRELRRISMESRRTSGERGNRSRLSDSFRRRSASSAGSRKSGGEVGATQAYYPFTRSQERTNAPSTTLIGVRTATSTAPASTTVPATVIVPSLIPISVVDSSTTPGVTSAPLPAPTTTATATTAATTPSSAPATYRPVVTSEQEKDERRRRSGSFIPLEPAVKPAPSPSKSSRLSRIFGAPPVSTATPVYADAKDSFAARAASAASAAASSLSRSKGPVIIEHTHTLTLSDL